MLNLAHEMRNKECLKRRFKCYCIQRQKAGGKPAWKREGGGQNNFWRFQSDIVSSPLFSTDW